MTLDERAGRAAHDVRTRMSDLAPEPLPAGFGQPSRRRIQAVLLVFVLVVAVAVPVALWRGDGGDESAPVGTGVAGVTTVGAWSAVPAASSGLDEATAVTDLVSTGDALVAVGGVGPGADAEGAIWRSTDGVTWERAVLDEPGGLFTAVGAHEDELLAVGPSGGEDATTRVYRSTDDGRSWELLVEADDVFGPPAPQMGRPNVDSVRWVDGGFWLAAGGASDGYAGVWTSSDGASWTQEALEQNRAGGAAVASGGAGYLAYWLSEVWSSSTGEAWSKAPVELPPGLGLYSVAEGAHEAVASNLDGNLSYLTPRSLLRSTDGGRSWTVDPRFLDQHPDAVGETIARFGGVEVIAGWTPVVVEPGTGERGRPGAWASTDDGSTWVAMPQELRESDREQWVTLLVTSIGDRVVMMSAGRPLDRHYLFEAPEG